MAKYSQKLTKEKKVDKPKGYTIIDQKGKEEYTKARTIQIKEVFERIIPSDVNSCLDIGAGRDIVDNFLRKKFRRYTTLDITNADIIQDLNKNTKIDLVNNSFDIVIVSNILEHLIDPDAVLEEAIRISNKYILIGLPNEYPLSQRIDIFLGNWPDGIYHYGHKHFFSIESAEMFVKSYFKNYEYETLFKFKKERWIPTGIQDWLRNNFPTLFAGERLYLVNKKDYQQVCNQ